MSSQSKVKTPFKEDVGRTRLAKEFAIGETSRKTFYQFIPGSYEREVIFMIIGLEKSPYEGGFYIGTITLDVDYPNKSYNVIMNTPNGRFDINRYICLTNTSYHVYSWIPSWTIGRILEGFVSIWQDDSEHGISHITNMSSSARKKLAAESMAWNMANMRAETLRFTQFVNPNGTVKTPQQTADFVNKCNSAPPTANKFAKQVQPPAAAPMSKSKQAASVTKYQSDEEDV